MAKKSDVAADGSPPVKPKSQKSAALSRTPLRANSLLDTRVVYCGDWHASHYVKVMPIFGENN